METLSFLTEDVVRSIGEEFATPTYVYDERALREQGRKALDFPNAFGLTVRYAMKALSNANIVRLFTGMRIHIDASSGFEAQRAMLAGVEPGTIQITAQQVPENLDELLEKGVLFTACSLEQLRTYGKLRPGSEVCVRINPGLGSGHSNRTNVGGPAASFGIWHEYITDIQVIEREFGLKTTQIHTHIGSGSDPEVWTRCARLSLGIVAKFPYVTTLGLGGGFKVGRMACEESADMEAIGLRVKQDFEDFAKEHGRELELEIEPGTFLVANAGALLCTAMDIVDTGAEGYTFIKIDGGMTEVARPSMYGAQHPIVVVPKTPEERAAKQQLVVGHCCESGDVLTPKPGDAEGLQTREMLEAQIGDLVVVGGAGAYTASMSCKNYNSFPEASEVLLGADGKPKLIRKRQSLEQIIQNEILL